MTLAKNIRYLRKKKGLSQEEIAEKLGYKSFTTIQKWESGVAEPPVKKLRELATVFNVDMEELANTDLSLGNEKLTYYLNDDTAELAQELHDRPQMKVLFDASRKATKEDLQMAIDILEKLNKK